MTIPHKSLTKAEEQVMQALWQAGDSFLKDIIECMPQPHPHSNTVATLLKNLIEKGYVTTTVFGRNNRYQALVKKEDYASETLGSVISSYFNGSYTNALSMMVDKKEISITDLELLLQHLKK